MSSPRQFTENFGRITTSSGSSASYDEPNLFRIPHSRMKELVSWPLKEAAALPDVQDMEPSLQAVYEAMWELKSHEYIENHYIMDCLKARLQARRVYNELVCNCHEDSMLLEVIELVEKFYTAQTHAERCAFGHRLQRRIRAFLEEFVTHMEQEEAVFQPLLVKNFEMQELVQMKKKVIEQHNIFREKIKGKKLKAVKRKLDEDVFDESVDFSLDQLQVKKSYCQEVREHLESREAGESPTEVQIGDGEKTEGFVSQEEEEEVVETGREEKPAPVIFSRRQEDGICRLPEELLMMVFSHLNPKDLLSSSGVCKTWNRVALSAALWKVVLPTQWARGLWSLDCNSSDLEKDCSRTVSTSSSSLSSSLESLGNGANDDEAAAATSSDEVHASCRTAKKDERIFNGVTQSLLPRIGACVSTLILSANRGITSQHVKTMLKQVLNVRYVDLSYTNVTFRAFAGLAKVGALRKLEELSLAGCRFVGDGLLHHLALCYFDRRQKKGERSVSHLTKLNLSGCRCVTSLGVQHLEIHQASLQDLDLSGCFKIDGETLSAFVKECPKLKPQKLSYCNDIEDGPYPDTANGCLNLECQLRFCCRNSKLIF